MVFELAFALLFAAQIVLISGYFPRRLAGRAAARADNGTAGPRPTMKCSEFLRLNTIIAGIGVFILAGYLLGDFTTSPVPILLATGGYFFLQVLPLVLAGARLARSGRDPAAVASNARAASPRLSNIVSPLLAGPAVVLVFAQLSVSLSTWNGGWNTHLLKMAIFAGANTVFAVLIVRNLLRARRFPAADRQGQLSQLRKVVSVLMLISIGLSVYFFAKDVLFDLDLQGLRPAMMSAFLQVLALVSFGALLDGDPPFATGLHPPVTPNGKKPMQAPVNRPSNQPE